MSWSRLCGWLDEGLGLLGEGWGRFGFFLLVGDKWVVRIRSAGILVLEEMREMRSSCGGGCLLVGGFLVEGSASLNSLSIRWGRNRERRCSGRAFFAVTMSWW